jgi:hypothetical protein
MEPLDRIGIHIRQPRARGAAYVPGTDEPAHAVLHDEPRESSGRRRAGQEAELSPEVIRRWLACLAAALLGLALLAEPGAAMEPPAAVAVDLQS